MTSPGQHYGSPAPSPAMLAKTPGDPAVAVDSISTALSGLEGLDERPVQEHVERFENVHAALTDALSAAENLLGGSGSHRS